MENALFATLDTAVRRAKAKDGRLYAYVDTVGFVRRLPTQLIEAFKSTLEEVSDADLIVHVVDGSHPDPFSQIDAVDDVLADIDGVETIPTIVNSAPIKDYQETFQNGRWKVDGRLVGCTASYFDVVKISLLDGRFFTDDENSTACDYCILGAGP